MWKFALLSLFLLVVFSVPAFSSEGSGFTISLALDEAGLSHSSANPEPFNVLDKAIWDPKTTNLTLIGHRDSRYKISNIPYRSYLTTILETSNPVVTLLWTEKSEKKVRQWIKNLDSTFYLEEFTRSLFQVFDEEGKLKNNRRWLGEVLDVPYISDQSISSPNRLQVMQSIFTQAGKADAGLILEGMLLYRSSNDLSSKTDSFNKMLSVTSNKRLTRKILRDVKKGRKPHPKTLGRAHVKILSFMERAFDLPKNSLNQIYFSSLENQKNPSKAFDKAYFHLMNLLPRILYKDLRKLFKRHQEIQIPSDVLISTAGFQPQMRSVYMGVKPDNPLAKLLFRADYLSKTLPHQTQLQGIIAGYQTEFSYYRSHPLIQNAGEKIGIRRQMWLFPDSTDWSIGKDRNSLEIREVKMGFHSQILDYRKEVMVEKVDYDEFLTAHYEPLAQHFPALHEIREASKLVVISKWLRDIAKMAGFLQKPIEFYQGPNPIQGKFYLTLAPQFRNGVSNLRFVAEGGIGLTPSTPKGLFQKTGKFTFSKDLSISHQKFVHMALKTLSQDLLTIKGEEKKVPEVVGLKGQRPSDLL